MKDDSIVTRANGIEFTRLDESHLAIDASAGYCYNLNPTAARIWALLAEPATVAALVNGLSVEYAVSVQECRDDVVRFLEDMHATGLIEVTDREHVAASA